MDDPKLAGEPIPWMTPVYVKKEGLESFAVCKHCNQIRMNHAGEEEKCLFDSTTFAVLVAPKK